MRKGESYLEAEEKTEPKKCNNEEEEREGF